MTTGQAQPISCIPLWVLEDIKNYLKKSTHRQRSQSISCQYRQSAGSPLQQRRRLRSEERWCGRPLRVALVGGHSVGKSALTVRFLTKRFIGEYRSDSDMLYRSVLSVSSTPQNVELLDCSGKELKEEVIQWAEAFIIVYSTTDKDSLDEAKATLQKIASRRPEAPVMLSGNKSDLGHQRQVTESEGKCLALNHDAKFSEVSAAEDFDSVSVAFNSFLKDIKVHRSKSSPRYRKLSPTKLLSSFMCRYNYTQPSSELIILNKCEQSKLSAKPSPL
ncbi:Small GTP-binding protein domain [Trinorchestia longiramus]|nr:Small GTP-binding protein domain [Trinorchestia longiramus]